MSRIKELLMQHEEIHCATCDDLSYEPLMYLIDGCYYCDKCINDYKKAVFND